MATIVVYNMEVLAHFCSLGVFANFCSILAQNQTGKMVKIHKYFELWCRYVQLSVSKCYNISNTYHSRKELKLFSLEIFNNIWDISTENCTRTLATTVCKKLS